MKTFIKWLNIFFLVIEIVAGIALSFGIFFRYKSFAGAKELLLLGFTSLALIYFLKAITPFYKRYISTSPSMTEKLAPFVRRLLYIGMMLYALALVFLSNNLMGAEEMMGIGFSAAIATSFIAAILLVIKRERMEVLVDAVVRMVCLFFLHWVLNTTATAESPTVTVGQQEWTSKNLNVDHFANGDAIPEAKTAEEWKSAGENKQPAWCYYDNDPDNGRTYGRLYNWYAVTDPRGLAPKGWHIPSDAEWTTMTDYLGVGASLKMKSTSGWNENANGNNDSGIAGLPGGFRYPSGSFHDLGETGNWWSSSEYETNDAWVRDLDSGTGEVDRYLNNKGYGFSVRCLRD